MAADASLPFTDRGNDTGVAPHGAYAFGPFCLLPSERQLLRSGRVVDLTPKAFDTLVVLVTRAGRLVTKDELMDAVWPDTVVEENYLSVNISKVRAALGETAGDPHYVETVVGHGYRFRDEVDVRSLEQPSDASTPEQTDSSFDAAGSLRSFLRTPALATGVAFLLGLAGLLSWGVATFPSEPTRSVAVLPLNAFPVAPSETEPVDAAPNYLRVGIADAIITKLGNLQSLVVRPTSAVLSFQAADTDPIAAGRALGVDVILSGFLQQTDGRLRLTMQLIDVAEARAVWSSSFEAPFTDVFAVQDAIASQVARTLLPELSPEAESRLAVKYTHDTEAYAAYLKGRYYWNQRTPDGLRRSLRFYEDALDMDPTYAMAYVGLAETYSLLVWYSGRLPLETFPKARSAAQQALRIDSTLVEAYTTLALVAWQHDWDAEAAERYFRQALALNPNYAQAHHGYGQFLVLTGQADDGIAHLQRARALAPLSRAISMDLGSAYLFSGNYVQAIDRYQHLLDRAPHFAVAYVFLGLAHELEGRYDAALAAHDEAIRLGGRHPLWLAEWARAHALAGQTDRAVVLLDELQSMRGRNYVSPFSLALVHVALDKPSRALTLLEEAIATKDPYLVYLHVHPHLDSLRTHSDFRALLAHVPLAPGPV